MIHSKVRLLGSPSRFSWFLTWISSSSDPWRGRHPSSRYKRSKHDTEGTLGRLTRPTPHLVNSGVSARSWREVPHDLEFFLPSLRFHDDIIRQFMVSRLISHREQFVAPNRDDQSRNRFGTRPAMGSNAIAVDFSWFLSRDPRKAKYVSIKCIYTTNVPERKLVIVQLCSSMSL